MFVDIMTIILAVFSLVGYLPQIVKCIRTKSSRDLSISSWVLWCVETTIWLVYLIVEDSTIRVILLELLSVVLNYFTLVLAVIYRNGKAE